MIAKCQTPVFTQKRRTFGAPLEIFRHYGGREPRLHKSAHYYFFCLVSEFYNVYAGSKSIFRQAFA